MSLTPQQLHQLPDEPGVYIFKDANSAILYIGKAQRLSQRVKSYWQRSSELTPAKQTMIEKISEVDYIIVPSETDALFLEASLIKQHKPPYNISLKDDKSWLYIRITRENYPRIMAVRRFERGKGYSFGPYTSARAVRQTIRILRNLFPYPSCNIVRHGTCVEYDRGQSIGPAHGDVPKEEYERIVQQAIDFLQGNHTQLIAELKKSMARAAQARHFEQAAKLRDQLQAVATLMLRQQVISLPSDSADVFSLARGLEKSIINLLRVRHGKILQQDNFTVICPREESDQDILKNFLLQYYLDVSDFPREIIFSGNLEKNDLEIFFKKVSARKIRLSSPQKGWRKRLLAIGRRNAEHALENTFARWQEDTSFGELAMNELARVLQLPHPPQKIETYDISNIQGRQAVGSMVVFRKGLPDKKSYRKFRIKTVFQSDDFSMLQEVLTRRLARGKQWPLPDLFVIDGGKGQVSAVSKVFAIKGIKARIIGLAKKQEEIFLPGDSDPIVLPRTSYALRLLQRGRDEAHRFAITYHRSRRQEIQIRSSLDDIPGVGAKRRKQLLRTFGSVTGVRQTSLEALAKIVGSKMAGVIKKYFER